jgi:hypothetical protein
MRDIYHDSGGEKADINEVFEGLEGHRRHIDTISDQQPTTPHFLVHGPAHSCHRSDIILILYDGIDSRPANALCVGHCLVL